MPPTPPSSPLASIIISGITSRILGAQRFTPARIPGLQLWLDADDDSTITQDSYTLEVTQWRDKSSNARVFTPASTDRYSRSVDFNTGSRRVIKTSKSATSGFASNSFDIATLFGANGRDITIFTCASSYDQGGVGSGATSSGVTLQMIPAAGNSIEIRHSRAAGVYNQRILTASDSANTASNASITGDIAIVTSQRNGTVINSWFNGQQVITNGANAGTAVVTGSTPLLVNCATVGGGGGLSGDMREILIYNRVLSAAERTKIENYLADKWIPGV
ncbi:MAG: hypothetical protein LW855_05630 [Alphaproteobacteria bacterium]|jgi:hypothetical protein|nr:hypothetical protein [Alphaproteobacteria bacterium]